MLSSLFKCRLRYGEFILSGDFLIASYSNDFILKYILKVWLMYMHVYFEIILLYFVCVLKNYVFICNFIIEFNLFL